jgi:hypothetical protein
MNDRAKLKVSQLSLSFSRTSIQSLFLFASKAEKLYAILVHLGFDMPLRVVVRHPVMCFGIETVGAVAHCASNLCGIAWVGFKTCSNLFQYN